MHWHYLAVDDDFILARSRYQHLGFSLCKTYNNKTWQDGSLAYTDLTLQV